MEKSYHIETEKNQVCIAAVTRKGIGISSLENRERALAASGEHPIIEAPDLVATAITD